MLKLIKVVIVAVVLAMGASPVWAGAAADNNKGFRYYNAGNMSEAMKWYRKAADQGLAVAQINLGRMYYQGEGVPQDYREAVKWFRKAAGWGHSQAQFLLGHMYYFGKGVPQDYVMAHLWLNLATTNGYADGAKARDIVAKEMTPAQIAAAQSRASACFNSNYRDCE